MHVMCALFFPKLPVTIFCPELPLRHKITLWLILCLSGSSLRHKITLWLIFLTPATDGYPQRPVSNFSKMYQKMQVLNASKLLVY